MNVADFITELCCKIDDALPNFPRHPQAILSLGELAAIGVLHATKNVSRFMAQPTVLGVADSYGIELRHPIREGRRERKIVKKGVSNHRWPRIGVRADVIVGGKLGIVQNQWGLIAD